MQNGGEAFAMGWHPETGFLSSRWSHYSELMMIYLLAIGSPSHPVSPDAWNSFARPVQRYAGLEYISGDDPIFVHQYSHAWFDFRGKRDAYTNYFENSVTATRAHKTFCLSMPNWYNEDYWGITASDSVRGYTIWGGPPSRGLIDGTVVPCAPAGSLRFSASRMSRRSCVPCARNLERRLGGVTGLSDAFHPAANWYNPDVLGIDLGISLLMAENLRTGQVWNTFMRNPEIGPCDAARRIPS